MALKARLPAAKRDGDMGINLNPFTWWNGATIGTWFGLRGKARVGEDELGNVYWEGGKDTAGNPRRWVIYNGSNDASRVSPEWFSWLHHQVDGPPDETLPRARPWQKPAKPNMTGTAEAYLPSGALDKGGVRAKSSGDYEAWSPDA